MVVFSVHFRVFSPRTTNPAESDFYIVGSGKISEASARKSGGSNCFWNAVQVYVLLLKTHSRLFLCSFAKACCQPFTEPVRPLIARYEILPNLHFILAPFTYSHVVTYSRVVTHSHFSHHTICELLKLYPK